MVDSIKLFRGQETRREDVLASLISLGYDRHERAAEPGDISAKGEAITVYPIYFDNPLRITFHLDTIESIRGVDAESGKPFEDHPFVVILSRKGLRRQVLSRRSAAIDIDTPIDAFIDIQPDDLIVHVDHGIGRYRGMKKLMFEDVLRDHIALEFADGQMLYVVLEDLHKVQKYIGFEGRPPRLSRLGMRLWSRTKEKTARGVQTMAQEFLEMQAKRALLKGYCYSPDTDWQREMEEAFPYKETPDQIAATLAIKKDMESNRPMDRLLCGDAGYGKTEVALRAAFKAVMDNKQAAIVVPTTLLAEQHYKTFTRRLQKYPVVIEMLSRFRSGRKQKKIVEALSKGGVDIIIGTHRLLSDDIRFNDLGLLIIDEEQRFGVLHKEKLKRMRLLVDILTLTATPIPRTLYMSLTGARDMSMINTPPLKRLAVRTELISYEPQALRKGIAREKQRGGQIFFVHNRIESIEKIHKRLQILIPGLGIAVAHGRMREAYLEKVMSDFIDGGIDCLLCTNIIESGIDIPNANTIFINEAHTFGLAELHQLRGRVGRFDRQAYCYLIGPEGRNARLATLEKFSGLGSGFQIALRDLELRGAGNILGSQQHGYINAVGFDLYCRLLRETINRLRRSEEYGKILNKH